VKLTGAALARVLLAVALATATAVQQGRAQGICTTNICTEQHGRGSPSDPGGSDNNNKVVWYIVGAVVLGVVGWAIKTQIFPDPEPTRPSPTVEPTPDQPPPLRQVQRELTPPAPRVGGAKGGPAGGPGATGQAALRRGFDRLTPGAAYVPNEVILDIPASVPTATLDAIAARHGMTRLETQTFRLIGRTLHRWRIDGGTSAPDMIGNIAGERQVVGAGYNYLYALAEQAQVNADQYAPQKLNLTAAHRLARGSRVLVAVIDSEVDASHPDLAGAIAKTFDASADDEQPHAHGTGMAGAIAARRSMLGTAPQASLLTVRAFSMRANSAEGTTFNILKGLDWAAAQGARIVNMSFAGPSDPRLRTALAAANKKGMVLIAAAGNAGPASPPLFPAADPNVIAVTATDPDDRIFSGANRGNHIAVAAPGVDILAPAPGGAYQLTTGTSVAAAEVSGAAALLIERNPALTPAEVRKILMDTARDLGPKGRDRDFGAGLVDALKAVTTVKPR
jgi:subtilisin family serine protease